jgi:uncharacterized protein
VERLWAALALVLVIEGALPFLSPEAVRRAWAAGSHLPDRVLRVGGFAAMLAGVALLYLTA